MAHTGRFLSAITACLLAIIDTAGAQQLGPAKRKGCDWRAETVRVHALVLMKYAEVIEVLATSRQLSPRCSAASGTSEPFAYLECHLLFEDSSAGVSERLVSPCCIERGHRSLFIKDRSWGGLYFSLEASSDRRSSRMMPQAFSGSAFVFRFSADVPISVPG
jgi:hypothetical protein